MIAATHAAFASGLYLGGSALFEYPADPISWAITVLFSILPDIDLPTSRVGRPLFWLSVRLEKQHGHRTITHSAIALLVVAGLASPLFSFHRADWYWAMVGGYWSHLWLDMLNMRGIDLFWPASVRVVMPGRPAYRMEVGSKAEMVLMSAFIVWAVAMYPVSQMGLRGGLHQMLKNFDMAFDEYRESAGTRWYDHRLQRPIPGSGQECPQPQPLPDRGSSGAGRSARHPDPKGRHAGSVPGLAHGCAGREEEPVPAGRALGRFRPASAGRGHCALSSGPGLW